MRLARSPAPLLLLTAALLAGCGSDSTEGTRSEPTPTTEVTGPATGPPGASARSCAGGAEIADLRVTGTGCDTAQAVATGWIGKADCATPREASRLSCTVRDYRCLGTATDSGIAVSCARPQRSIAFVAKRD